MKKTVILLAVAFFMVITSSNAQALSKKALVSGLSDSGIVSMKPEQKKGFEGINSSLVSDLTNMDKKSLSKADRDKEVDRLFDKRDNEVDKLFGNDPDYLKKYKKDFKKKSRGIRTKIKLAKMVL